MNRNNLVSAFIYAAMAVPAALIAITLVATSEPVIEMRISPKFESGVNPVLTFSPSGKVSVYPGVH